MQGGESIAQPLNAGTIAVKTKKTTDCAMVLQLITVLLLSAILLVMAMSGVALITLVYKVPLDDVSSLVHSASVVGKAITPIFEDLDYNATTVTLSNLNHTVGNVSALISSLGPVLGSLGSAHILPSNFISLALGLASTDIAPIMANITRIAPKVVSGISGLTTSDEGMADIYASVATGAEIFQGVATKLLGWVPPTQAGGAGTGGLDPISQLLWGTDFLSWLNEQLDHETLVRIPPTCKRIIDNLKATDLDIVIHPYEVDENSAHQYYLDNTHSEPWTLVDPNSWSTLLAYAQDVCHALDQLANV